MKQNGLLNLAGHDHSLDVGSAQQTYGFAKPGQRIDIKPYDPTYYSAYDITQPVTVSGLDGCGLEFAVPDIDARLQELQDLLSTLDADATPEDENLPDIGGLLASTVSVLCVSS